MGFVAIYAAPFPVNPAPFVRDVLFYLVGALFLFYVYLSGEIFVWQAVGFVGFYAFFVGFVFWMDFGSGRGRERAGLDGKIFSKDCETGEVAASSGLGKEENFSFRRMYKRVNILAISVFLIKFTGDV